MKVIIIGMLLHITSCAAYIKILADTGLSGKNFSDCTAKFVKEKFDKAHVIIYKKAQSINESNIMSDITTFISKILLQSGYSISVWTCAQERCEEEEDTTYPQFVIHADDAEELDYTLSRCICTQYSAASEFIILSHSENEAYKMLKVIWKNNISRIRSTVISRDLETGNLKYYKGYYRCPGMKGNKTFTYDCSSKRPQNVDVITKQPISSYLSFFKWCVFGVGARDALPFAFLGDSRQVRLLGLDSSRPHYLGAEIAMLENIVEGRNHSNFNFSNVSDVHTLGTYNKTTNERTGLIKELFEGRVDIVLGAIRQGAGGVHFANSYPILRGRIIAVVQKQKNLNIFAIFDTFNYQIWLLILFLTLFFVSIISVCFRRYSSINISTAVMYLLAALLGKEIPIRNANFKLIFISWITFSLFIRTCFEALSVRHLANKDENIQIDSLQYICKNNFIIFVPNELTRFGVYGISTIGCTLDRDRFVVVKNPLECLKKDTTGAAAAFVYEEAYIYEQIHFVEDDGVIPFHVVKERVTEIPFVFLVRKGDLLQTFLQDRAMRTFEAGLLRYIETRGNFYHALSMERILREKDKGMSLKLKHMEILFYLYFFGVGLATITFVGEIIVFKFSKHH